MNPIGKILILLGVVFLVAGFVLSYASHLSFFKLGRLPGDLFYQRGKFSFYFPITTSFLLSLALTFLFWLFSRK
jgi:hypothetical protein